MSILSHATCLIMACTLLSPCVSLASSTAQAIVNKSIESEQKAQKKISSWQQAKPSIIAQIQNKKLELDWLTHQQNKYSKYIATIEANIAEMERQHKELDAIANAVDPLLQVTLERVTNFIENDTPFLSAERQERIEGIKKVLADPHTPQAEQLRRMLEILEVETGYGSDIEMADEEVILNDQKLHATTLRAGRLAYYCISPDKKHVGVWSTKDQKFIQLEGSDVLAVLELQKIARRKQIVEVTSLPLTTAVQTQELSPSQPSATVAENSAQQEAN